MIVKTVDQPTFKTDQFEKMYGRLRELEEKEEARLLEERIERLEKQPETAISLRNIRRKGRNDG